MNRRTVIQKLTRVVKAHDGEFLTEAVIDRITNEVVEATREYLEEHSAVVMASAPEDGEWNIVIIPMDPNCRN